MAIDLQIRADLLASIIANAVQEKLLETCFPQIGTNYIDHANVAPLPVKLLAVGGQVHARVPIELFVVERAKLLAAPNTVPDGAATAAGIVTLVLEIAAAGAAIALRCVDVEPGPLAGGLGGTGATGRCGLLGAASAPLTLNLAPMFAAVRAPVPAVSRVELLGGIVAIRFDPVGPGVDRLIPGQPWGLFIDAPAVVRLASAQMPAKALQRLQSFAPGLAPRWSPDAGLARVEMTTSAFVEFDFLGIEVLTVDFTGGITIDLLLIPGVTGFLKIVLRRAAHIDAGALVPRATERKAERSIKALMDPTKTGAPKTPKDFVKTGEDTFEKLIPLPPIALGKARLRYDVILGTAPGMAIGGAVLPGVAASRETLRATVRPFGLPSILFTCRELAKSGTGDPPRHVSIDQTSTSGWINLTDGGAFCGFEILQPPGLEPYVSAPSLGTGADPRAIVITIPSGAALTVTKPVQLIVRTSRGVRFLDLGVPPRVAVDAEGNVLNAIVNYIDNCFYLTADSPYRIDWGARVDRSLFVPPLEDPSWSRWIAGRGEIDTQLVSLAGLQPGELLQYRSADHQVHVTADAQGRAVVPVVPPAGAAFLASLTRTNRLPVGRDVKVQSALFTRAGTLAAASGEAELNPQPLPPVAARALRRALRGQAEGASEAALNPQPLPPNAAGALERALRRTLPDLTGIVRLPGFEDSPIAIAIMADGAKLIVDVADRRRPRVSGSFEGPIGPLAIHGDWAAAPQPGGLAIFRVRRS